MTNEQKLRKGWEQEIEFCHSEREQAQRDLAALRAENAKLHEALQEISRYLENPDTQFAVPMIAIVRAALA